MITGFIDKKQTVLCRRCAEKKGITESVLDVNGIGWEWTALTRTDEVDSFPVCEDCGFAIDALLTKEGRKHLTIGRVSFAYMDELDKEKFGTDPGWYFVYGSFLDHGGPDSWFGPYPDMEAAIYYASEDIIENLIEFA